MWHFTSENELVHECRSQNREYISSRLSENGDWYCLGCFTKAPEPVQFSAEWKKCRCAEWPGINVAMRTALVIRVFWELTGRG